jgi:putative endonuclease
MAKHLETGKKGEILAEEILKKKGYIILHRNWRFKQHELDIIAKLDQLIVFIEVKTRSDEDMEIAAESINEAKIRKLSKAADHFLKSQPENSEVRFDVVLILGQPGKPVIHHFEDAFRP